MYLLGYNIKYNMYLYNLLILFKIPVNVNSYSI